MSEISLLVAEDYNKLFAVAHDAGKSIKEETIVQFDGVRTYSSPNMTNVGSVLSGDSGFMAFAD